MLSFMKIMLTLYIPKQHPMYAIIGLNEVISAIENLLTDHTDRLDAIDAHLIIVDQNIEDIFAAITDINERIEALRTVESTRDTDTALLEYHTNNKSLECNVRVYESRTPNQWNRIRIVPGGGLCVPSDQFNDTSSIAWTTTLAAFPDDSLSKIFNDGIYFNHYGSSNANVYSNNKSAWSYSNSNGISKTANDGSVNQYHEGFVSGTLHSSFKVMASLGSTDTDDDSLTFLMYVTDQETGYPHTLAVVLSPSRNQQYNPSDYCVYYDYHLPGHRLIAQASDLGTTPSKSAGTTANGSYWSYYPNGIKIYVEKEDNKLWIRTSDFNSLSINSDNDIYITLIRILKSSADLSDMDLVQTDKVRHS